MVSTSGSDLISNSAKFILVEKLLSLADVITPNLAEAKVLLEIIENISNKTRNVSGRVIDSREKMIEAERFISQYTRNSVLIKGGHLDEKACDVLIKNDLSVFIYENNKINTKNIHGTGCTLSSDIASNLALGNSIERSV